MGDAANAGPTGVTLTSTDAAGAASTDSFTLRRPGNCQSRRRDDARLPPDVDSDDDGVLDEVDNCPEDPNAEQPDADGDGYGDACDASADTDGDGVADGVDNAARGWSTRVRTGPRTTTASATRARSATTDGDGVADNVDNCDTVTNPGQQDADGDRHRRRLRAARRRRGRCPDDSDNCPSVANADQADADGDGVGQRVRAGGPRRPHRLPRRRRRSEKPPQPEQGKSVVAGKVSGTIRIRLKNGKFKTLGANESIPLGSTIDATKGRVRLTSAAGGGKTQTADFYKGQFKITQTKGKKPITQLELNGTLSCGGKASAAAKKKKKVRSLWGDGKGRFRTKGRRAAATVRGTKWFTQDTCTSTKITVKRGVVQVRDFVKRKNVTVKKGHSYVARKKRK